MAKNKYPVGGDMQNMIAEGKSFNAASTQGMAYYPCPQCGASPGFHCETPSGRRAQNPHGYRTQLAFASEGIHHQLNKLAINLDKEGTQSDGTS